ncbi:MAG: Gfo/Idh/MocA family oxidoreductase [Liquorilactobacillus ghanensis]|uniref:Gfo/Idh/MocA family protein n=1 Tax=Liquorilactobacillus ghanensis TaxID=399370 RepID=UPI0039EC3924
MAVKIKYGVIGSEAEVAELAAALAASQTGKLAGIVGNSSTAATLVAQDPQIKIYSNEQALLQSDLDVIYLAEVQQPRFEIAKQALLNGKHLLLKKPLTRHFVGASELYRLAKQQQRLVVENQAPLFSPIIAKVKELLAADQIGQIKFIDVKCYLTDVPTNFSDLSAGGGALFNGGPVILGMIQSLTGNKIANWNGFEINQIGQADLQCNLALTAGDVLANVMITANFPVKTNLTIYGTKGTIRLPEFDQQTDTAILENASGSQRFVIENQRGNLYYAIEHVSDCLQHKMIISPVVSPESALTGIKVIDSLYQRWYGDPLN